MDATLPPDFKHSQSVLELRGYLNQDALYKQALADAISLARIQVQYEDDFSEDPFEDEDKPDWQLRDEAAGAEIDYFRETAKWEEL